MSLPAAGSALLSRAGWRAPSLPLHFGMAVAVGLALSVTLLYLPFAITGTVHFLPALVVLGIGSLDTLVRCARDPRGSFAALRNPFWIGLGIVAFVTTTLATTAPFWGYDAKAIYGIKGKALLHERNLEGPLFQDPEVVHYHGDYPLGLPLVIALSGYAARGVPDDPQGIEPAPSIAVWFARHQSVHAYASLACLWGLGALGFVVHAARRATSGRIAIVFLTALALPLTLVFPWVGGRSFSLEGADVPLTLCLGAAGWMFVEHVRTRARAPLLLAALLAATSLWLKNDGVIALAALVAATLACSGVRRNAWAAVVLALGMGAAVGVAASVAAGTAGAPYDERYLAALLETDAETLRQRLPVLLRSVRNTLEKREMLEYWAFVLAIAVPWGLYRGSVPRILALWVLGHVLAMTAIFLITPNSVTWHIATALPRLWSQVALPAGGLLVLCVGAAWRQLATPLPSAAADAAG